MLGAVCIYIYILNDGHGRLINILFLERLKPVTL